MAPNITSTSISFIQATYAAAVIARERPEMMPWPRRSNQQRRAFGGDVGVQRRTEIGHARVAEEIQLDVVVLRQLVQQVIEIPADAGQRLVKRADVDADAQLALAARGRAKRVRDALAKGMAQSVNDGAERGRHRSADRN